MAEMQTGRGEPETEASAAFEPARPPSTARLGWRHVLAAVLITAGLSLALMGLGVSLLLASLPLWGRSEVSATPPGRMFGIALFGVEGLCWIWAGLLATRRRWALTTAVTALGFGIGVIGSKIAFSP